MQDSLSSANVPEYVAVIMEGNRRWINQRGLPKAAGHAAGVKPVRGLIEACSQQGVRWLTLFAFSEVQKFFNFFPIPRPAFIAGEMAFLMHG